ncbi:MAG: hypothetical protein JKY56_20740 [Kofleriaceae bacterium]|nr:hypothetical protein [Kofleriaceae bacterium]
MRAHQLLRPASTLVLACTLLGCKWGYGDLSDTTDTDASVDSDAAVAPDAASFAPVTPNCEGVSPLVGEGGPIQTPQSCEGGTVSYIVGGQLFRTTLGTSVVTENVSAGLDLLSVGSDFSGVLSPNGDWLLLETSRFDSECEEESCLALVNADLSSGEVIKLGNQVLHGDDYSAVDSSGQRIVYPFDGGPNSKDLFAINKLGNAWTPPILLTAESPFPFNRQPSINADGSKVVFDCGNDPFGQPPTSICEVQTDGCGFRVVWTPEQGATGAAGRSDVALHHPSYLSDGSIVFESDWNSEQIWRLAGEGPPVVIAGEFSNDNSPCVMQNGCIVSLWLGRPGGTGTHELKIMDQSGGNFSMLRTGIDIVDTGTSCAL